MLEIHSEIKKAIFVGNLHSSVKEEILYELFLQAGPVQKVIIPKDREGHQRPYGFVYYKHAEAAPYAMELLNGTWLYGRPINLKYTFGHSQMDCETASPHVQNCLAEDRPSPQADYSWFDTVGGLSLNYCSPTMPIVELQYWPLACTPCSVVPLWPWSDYEYASWIPYADEPLQALSNTQMVAEQSTENDKHQKQIRKSHEKRHKHKRRQDKHIQN